MINKKITKILLGTLCLTICYSLFSCDTCNEQMTSVREVKIRFAKRIKNVISDSTVNNLYIVINKGNRLDSIYNNVSTSNISLPLDENPNHETSKFIMITDSIHHDTLTFIAKHHLRMVSAECGFNTEFSNISLKYSNYHIERVLTIDSTNLSSDVNSLNYIIVLRNKTQ